MTREERIEKLRHLITCMKCEVSGKSCDDNCPTQYNAGNMGEIIENLEEIAKTLEQELCDDCISRQAALDTFGLSEKSRKYGGDHSGYDTIMLYEVQNALEALPSVQPKQKTGHWIIKDGKEQGYDIGGVKTWYIQIMCSECGFIKTAVEGHTKQYHYCPNCGAKMEE